MNKQFTASEVRGQIAWLRNVTAVGTKTTYQMLDAFADLLEAQERAVPVVTRESAINAIEHVGRYNGPGRETEARQMLVEGSPSVAHPAQAQPQTDGLHPATAELVDRFSDALREKLLEAQRKYGYSDNWQRSDWMDGCRQQLREHLAKGDPRDVAAYCAFLWHHGESTAQAQPPAASVTDAPVPVFSWRPIETAPKNNKRPLLLARFNDDGSLQSFDYDASWMSESESWEIPEVYFFWASANGNVEEPTHWAYQPAGFDKIEAALATQENPNG